MRPGAEACAMGTYAAAKHAVVYGKNSGVPIRLIPGNAEGAMRRFKSASRAPAVFGIVFFLLMHGFMGAACFLSSTYEARMPESEQSARLAAAIYHEDLDELERLLAGGIPADVGRVRCDGEYRNQRFLEATTRSW
ncbi:MAG: hypothetical protein AB1714_16875 [Acidobacteriota bacterium]